MSKCRKRKKVDWVSLMVMPEFYHVLDTFYRMDEEFKRRPRFFGKYKRDGSAVYCEKKSISDNRLAFAAFRRCYSTITLNELRDKYGVL